MPTLARDGVRLHFEHIEGAGEPVVLVHGWCCDHTHFAPQVAHFAERGCSVVALDLRGHGRSDKPEGGYPIGLFADDVAWLCGALGLSKPVVIGHSMGGTVAFDLASRYPDLPGAIVMLDSAVLPPATVRSGMLDFVARLKGPDHAAAVRAMVGSSLFIPTDDATRKAAILDLMASAPQHVMVAAYRGLIDFDATAHAGAVACPSLYIVAGEAMPRSDMERLGAAVPGLQQGRTVGSGHFCQLEVPEQVNAMIDRFLALSLGGGPLSMLRKSGIRVSDHSMRS